MCACMYVCLYVCVFVLDFYDDMYILIYSFSFHDLCFHISLLIVIEIRYNDAHTIISFYKF